ncbi:MULTISPECIES: PAS domain S-box protein [Methanoculleus]|uniref:histidine kinase n=2 Tax=Methanoculleus TaxID=45989 RepID=A3CVQ7_METMJ|nr:MULTISPECIES: PAS domain S-box protein [Methanoculleus]ABN57457.1 PAS/PAC sensor signal transduction histidine kinase [Methanoculleus marisnigri JR1]MCC7556088.1 PAS domain S-box protein [Methanoculleus marisnigri]UYU18862.1 PAS domain S-box protein [Methanoculleus submarinus]
MSTSPGTTEKRTSLTGRDEKQDNAGEVEQLIRERTAELREENDALRRENAELRQIEMIYASAPVGLCLLGTDTRYLHVNQRFAEMDGFSVEEHIGKRVRELVPDLADAAEELARAVVATGKPALDIEVRGETPAQPGEQRHWNESWRPVTDNQGRVIAISIAAEDITERKRAEEALRESEERFTAFMDNSPAVAFMKDEQGRYIYLNKFDESHFNRRQGDLRGKTDFELWPLYVAEQLWKNDQTVLKADSAIEVVEEMPNPKGGITYWWACKFPFKDASAKRYVGGIGIDITDWKQAEAALQESEEKYRNLVELAPEPIAVHCRGNVVYANPPCVTLFGAERREDLVGKPVLQFVHPDDHEVFRGRYREMREKGTTVPLRAERFVRLDGQVVDVEVVATPILYENLPSVMVLFRDITERKRAEEAFQRYAENLGLLHGDLEVANREANLYLDILTHDIGNTENVSNLYADLLIESLDGEAAGYAKKLQRSVQKSIEILGIVSTIRRIHRTKTELKPTDLDAAVRGVMSDYPTSIFLYNGTTYQVQADDLLPVVFDNLISNAVKFGGPDVEIAIRIEENDGFVRVSVEDTGPGIPNDDKNGIFHCYEMKKRGVGKGLGLYLVKILVERYGGTIWAEDRVTGRPDEGAAFKLTLKPASQTR